MVAFSEEATEDATGTEKATEETKKATKQNSIAGMCASHLQQLTPWVLGSRLQALLPDALTAVLGHDFCCYRCSAVMAWHPLHLHKRRGHV